MECDKNDDRGILAGPEDVSGKKAVDPETTTAPAGIPPKRKSIPAPCVKHCTVGGIKDQHFGYA
jgi:hypothetical protein